MEEELSTTRFLMLGALETLINQALEHDPRGPERLGRLHGTAIRIRTEQPMMVIYILIYEDGVELHPEYEGPVDVRIRGPLGALLQWLLSPNAALPEGDRIRILGPEDRISLLSAAVSEFSLWGVARNWLDEHVRLNELLGILRREDPRWLERLQNLPEEVGAIGDELGRQRLLQEDILGELQALRSGLHRQRQLDLLAILLGVGLLLAAMATAGGQLPLLAELARNTQTLLLASIGLTLLCSRLLFGYRNL